jgi:hypothetical protein
MHRISVDVNFQSPCGICVSGPTMSGKSTFTFRLIQSASSLFTPPPERIVYAYGVWQEEFANSLPKHVELINGLSEIFDDENYFDPSVNNLLIIDDLMQEVSTDSKASALFTKGIPHKNVSVLFLVQNLFKQGKSMRDIALNCQYLIIFKNKRDALQVKYLAKQLDIKHFEKAYNKATKETFGYLLVDLHPKSSDLLRMQSHIFDHRRIYLENGFKRS